MQPESLPGTLPRAQNAFADMYSWQLHNRECDVIRAKSKFAQVPEWAYSEVIVVRQTIRPCSPSTRSCRSR